jgi:hypothetical protein
LVKLVIHEDQVKTLIHEIRGIKVILDYDLAQLYGVETGQLKRAVRRNIERFPEDFMFEITREEYNSLRRQIGILEPGKGEHAKYLPFAFTEQGVAMLSSVLKSKRAVEVNIAIMRAFVQTRQISFKYEELAAKLEDVLEMTISNKKEIEIVKELLGMTMLKGGAGGKKH